jgi:hypothetical protein
MRDKRQPIGDHAWKPPDRPDPDEQVPTNDGYPNGVTDEPTTEEVTDCFPPLPDGVTDEGVLGPFADPRETDPSEPQPHDIAVAANDGRVIGPMEPGYPYEPLGVDKPED